MRNLLRFIVRYSFQIIFVFLEVICLVLVFSQNPLPHARFYQLAQGVNGFVYNQVNHVTRFFHLSFDNSALVAENARLRNELSRRPPASSLPDSLSTLINPEIRYDHIPAMVINNSVHKQNNYLTINVGTRHGIRPDMGVVGPDGIVGVIRNVSANFSTVLSVLNSKFRGSVKLSGQEFFGTLSWDGHDYREAVLTEIPGHIRVYENDQVVTSGFSAIFPPGEPVGTVVEVKQTPAGSFYELRIGLSQDFKKLTRVYVIRNFSRQEQLNLETQTYD